ncbi:hypothetical protein CCR75_003062 [Bremia lactucae]|uniref:Uncharacterized protein n=1 Tax=Bremia lactucae TaxID=4779 RepID=A0A976IMJ6_BRELC|nr:hypothetical protein CCR75_003062 [Bremia lactucae]
MMGYFPLSILFIFPPPSTSTPFDLTRLHSSFVSLVEQDYPILIGELYTEPKSGVISVMQTAKHRDNGAYQIKFETNPRYSMTTRQAIQSRSWELMPSSKSKLELIRVSGTLLRDGGLAVGIDTSHMLFDGEAIFTFMTVWGQHYSGVKKEERLVVSHERQLMNGTNKPSKMEHPEFRVDSDDEVSSKSNIATQTLPARRYHNFHFSPNMMKKIKEWTNNKNYGNETTNVSYASTLDAVTALFTILITRARAHSQDVKITTFVNARLRLEPSLPRNYVGNVTFNALSTYANSELQPHVNSEAQVSPETLSKLAHRVRESILRCNNDFMRDALNFLAEQTSKAVVKTGTNFAYGTDLAFSSWLHMGMYNANFDGVHPWFASCLGYEGTVFITEAQMGGQGIDVGVTLECGALQKLERMVAKVCEELEKKQ